MSQSPHPHDPYGTEPSAPVPEQPVTSDPAAAEASQDDFLGAAPPHSESSAPAEHAVPASGFAPQDGAPQQHPVPEDQSSPTSDPALHPHDPFAYPAGSQQPAPDSGAENFSASSPYASPAPSGNQGPYSAPSSAPGGDPYAAPAAGASGYSAGPQGPSGAQEQYGPSGQYGAQGHGAPGQHGQYAPHGAASLDVPPPGFKGVHEGPLSGQPLPDTDAKTWALVVHLAALLQFVIPFVGGLIAQIVLYVIFKDRNRFVRYNAAEALNGTIAALIISLAMGAVFTIITIVTFGIGAFLFGLMFVPTLVQAIFAIIGAIRAYQGTWWNYPVNVRLVK